MKNPMGFLYFINTIEPKYHKIRRFVFAEDTGSAIKGQIRFDFFWGSGNESGSRQEKQMKKLKVGLYYLIIGNYFISPKFCETDHNLMPLELSVHRQKSK